jgi:hypothetical protein
MPREGKDEQSNARVLDGSAWQEFCENLAFARNQILDENSPADPFHRAEGLRYLSRLVRAGFETFIENGDPAAPELRRNAHETIKMGADNPDNHYLSCPISGEYEYRIRGTRGTVYYLGIGAQEGGYGSTGSLKTTAYLDASDMKIAPDGSFEILVSAREQKGNWLAMTPQTRLLIVRQTFLDRSRERPAEMKIERTDGPHVPRPITAYDIDRALRSSAMFVAGCAQLFNNWVSGFLKHVNELPQFDIATATAMGGIPDCVYYHSYWRLAPDEALVIEVTPPKCDYWNFQLNNHWMESLDYRYHRIALNKHDAKLEPDGSVRIVVAHEDPGHPNWLTTAAHDRGTMCLRWIRADHHPEPRTRVVKIRDLRA